MNEYNNILDNIKEIRISKGYGQEYIAAQLNVTQACYANWEKGKRELTYNNLLKIARCIGVDIVDIITHNKPKQNAEELTVATKTNEKVSITFEVDPQQRDYLLHLVMGDRINSETKNK